MNSFEKEIYNILGKDNFNKVQSVKIGIAGAGGLGSNCACNLVRTGIKQLKVIDFDVVEYSNLNRQFYFIDQQGIEKVEALKKNLLRINPDLDAEFLVLKLERENIKEIFPDCDIVIEAFDKAEYKSMLVETMLPSGKMIISASGLAGFGRSDEIRVNRVKDNLVIIGDLKTGVDKHPPLSPRVAVAAAKQADVVLETILGI